MLSLAGSDFRPMTRVPPELRATVPAEMRGLRRDHVRLMVLDRARQGFTHTRFDHIGDFLLPGDLLVVNTSRTLPAAVPARRVDGSVVQVRPCVRRPGSWDVLVVEPQPPFGNVPLRDGEPLLIGEGLVAVVAGRRPDIPLLWRLEVAEPGLDEIVSTGDPIRYSYIPRPISLDFYQTVYAGRPGSAEMASAGRPFSRELLLSLRRQGVDVAEVLLHTGLSSYQDDDFDSEHHLFEEWYEVDATAVDQVRGARRVIAVGTTAVRALETAAIDGVLRPMRGWTDLKVTPATRLNTVDAMVTGMHEPGASHIELLEALVEPELLYDAYDEAIAERYLWHEFGDSMLIL